jgi:hypothetical protein
MAKLIVLLYKITTSIGVSLSILSNRNFFFSSMIFAAPIIPITGYR